MFEYLKPDPGFHPPEPASSRFLQNKFMLRAMNASLARCQTCDNAANDADTADFRQSLGQELRELATHYTKAVNEKTHIRNIEQLANKISASHSNARRNAQATTCPGATHRQNGKLG